MILAPTLSLLSSGSGAIVRPTFSRDFAGEKTLNNGTGPAITFTRGSQATYFDANGTLRFAPHNAIRNSQAGGSTNGVIGSGGVMPTHWAAVMPVASSLDAEVVGTGTQDGLTYLDVRVFGTNASASVVYPLISFETQTGVTATAGQVWTGSFYAAIVGGSTAGMTSITADVRENTSGGAYVSNGATAHALTASLQRCSHTRTLTGATTERVNVQLVPFVSGSATIDITFRIAAPQLERNATPSDYIPTTGTANFDQPRFDHSGGTSLGLLIEEARTNIALHSADLANAHWAKTNVTVTSNTDVAPDGTTTADTVEDTTTGSTDNLITNQIVGGAANDETFTWSFFIKKTTGATNYPAARLLFSGGTAIQAHAVIDTNNGTITATGSSVISFTASVQNAGSYWRVICTGTNNSTGNTNVAGRIHPAYNLDGTGTQDANATGSIVVWGGQLEKGAFPTSYIPTTSAAVTRSADSAVVTPISSFYNASEGTLFAEVREGGSDLQYGAVSLDTNTSDNRIDLRRNANSSAVSMIVTAAGAGQMLESPPLTAAAQTYKFIGAYKTDDVVACVNGGTIAFDTSVTLPTLTHLRIGGLAATSPATGNAFEANGHIRKIAYYPKRLSNALLQSLTA